MMTVSHCNINLLTQCDIVSVCKTENEVKYLLNYAENKVFSEIRKTVTSSQYDVYRSEGHVRASPAGETLMIRCRRLHNVIKLYFLAYILRD